MGTYFFFIVVALIALGGWYLWRKRNREKVARQKSNRTRLMATVKKIEERKSTRLIRNESGTEHVEHTAYVLVAQAENPRNRDLLTFRSFAYTEVPAEYPVGSEVPVMVDLENPTDYKVESK